MNMEMTTPIQYGWVCPTCHRVYSPNTIMCFDCPQKMAAITTTVQCKQDPGTFTPRTTEPTEPIRSTEDSFMDWFGKIFFPGTEELKKTVDRISKDFEDSKRGE